MLFAHPKVGQFYMSVLVQEYIVRLQISVQQIQQLILRLSPGHTQADKEDPT